MLDEVYSENPTRIQLLQYNEAYKNAGILSTLDGNTDTHVKYLTDKNQKWANDTLSYRLTPSQKLQSFIVNHYAGIR